MGRTMLDRRKSFDTNRLQNGEKAIVRPIPPLSAPKSSVRSSMSLSHCETNCHFGRECVISATLY